MCIQCRGAKLLCGKARCPILVRWDSMMKTAPMIDRLDLDGSSPPGVFVGRFGYPKVFVGPLVPPVHGDTRILDAPEEWVGHSMEDIVREAMNVDKLDLEYLEGIDERRKRAMDERVKRLEDYTRAVMTAWKDGRVTATERLLVEQLRENLGISREEQDRIESQVIEEVLEDRTGIYRAVAEEALEDGPITEDERELLEALRKKLGLSARDCREIEAEIGKPAS